MSEQEKKVVAIQVAPFRVVSPKNGADIDGRNNVEIQPNGADQETIGHAVYLRYSDGDVKHVVDRKYEADAAQFAKVLCEEHQVGINLYDWQIPHVNLTHALRQRAV